MTAPVRPGRACQGPGVKPVIADRPGAVPLLPRRRVTGSHVARRPGRPAGRGTMITHLVLVARLYDPDAPGTARIAASALPAPLAARRNPRPACGPLASRTAWPGWPARGVRVLQPPAGVRKWLRAQGGYGGCEVGEGANRALRVLPARPGAGAGGTADRKDAAACRGTPRCLLQCGLAAVAAAEQLGQVNHDRTGAARQHPADGTVEPGQRAAAWVTVKLEDANSSAVLKLPVHCHGGRSFALPGPAVPTAGISLGWRGLRSWSSSAGCHQVGPAQHGQLLGQVRRLDTDPGSMSATAWSRAQSSSSTQIPAGWPSVLKNPAFIWYSGALTPAASLASTRRGVLPCARITRPSPYVAHQARTETPETYPSGIGNF